MPEGLLALHVGGTTLRGAALDRHGEPLAGSLRSYPLPAQASREETLALFYQAIQDLLYVVRAAGLTPIALGAGFPGPFDFERGQSLMSDRLAAIRGLPLEPLLSGAAGGIPVRFLHESSACLLGEYHGGAAMAARSPALLLLGSGLDLAYMRSGRVCVSPDQRPRLALWQQPFQMGTAEDYVSRRAIRERFAFYSGLAEPPDVQGIALLARAGDLNAIQTFQETGDLLAQLLAPVLSGLDCDLLVLGGPIARSADLFIAPLRKGLAVPVTVASHLDDAALRGAGHYCLWPAEESLLILERD